MIRHPSPGGSEPQMLRLLGPGTRPRDGRARRELRRIRELGVLGAGLTLADLAAGETRTVDPEVTSGAPFGRAKSCILLFLMGGPPQHSTWDPKPDAPAQVRGDFGPIVTGVPGLSLCELLPRTALVADKLCVLRAMSTGDNAHSSSGYYMLTGRPHQPQNVENANPGSPNDAPSLGALLGRIGPASGGLPPSVTLPMRISNTDGSVWPGQDAGLLALKVLEQYLKAIMILGDFDVTDAEVIGTSPEMTWGQERGRLEKYQSGQLAKLPREALYRADELTNTT